MKSRFKFGFMVAFLLMATVVTAQDQTLSQEDELAKKLQNPVADLISLPFQFNFDFGVGPADGSKMTLNIQPVIPVSISDDWNLITRTIIPVISQNDIAGNSGSQFGLGDVVATGFFSPKAPTASGIIWGVGPAVLIPTSTHELLGVGEFGAGPSAVALTQKGSLTVGALVNHIWADNFSNTFINPFISQNFTGGYAIVLNTEMNVNWENDNNPYGGVLMIQGSKVFNIGTQPCSFVVGPRIHYGGARTADWGIKAQLTLMFPKG
ncbi:hypothetical protein [Joostella sp. CR20]|uniref:hypothetical protein n=1 Tax=Joostella sp. CR20 TaxID=2804312 RepID=UPI00313E65AE